MVYRKMVLIQMNLEHQRRYRLLFRFYDWVVNEQKFVESHEEMVSAIARLPVQARTFVAKAAVGFLDCLNLNGDGAWAPSPWACQLQQ